MGRLKELARAFIDTYYTVRRIDRRAESFEAAQLLLTRSHHTEALERHARYQDPRHLARYGWKSYSQNDEDGILQEIFARVPPVSRTFIEFGVGDGMENNTVALLLQGWSGTWFEGSDAHAAKIRETFRKPIAARRLHFRQAFIDAEGIEGLFAEAGVPEEPDLLCIDIDGNDWWVWKAITRYRPRVVVMEYNAGLGPAADLKMRYDRSFMWNAADRAYGASLKALENLGREKGYSLVGCNFTGVNAFFVRDDLLGDRFLAPYTSEQHWEPPKHYMRFSPGQQVSPAEIEAFFD